MYQKNWLNDGGIMLNCELLHCIKVMKNSYTYVLIQIELCYTKCGYIHAVFKLIQMDWCYTNSGYVSNTAL